ncbi:MAG: radical SAM family heme chaperone HemW [Dehalococcoidia bacterium]|nr:radical SAM family heme chaperone HemW [Dehalococcoidia bacterium]
MSLGVYIHIPFCVLKCGYCDFNTYANLESLKLPYASALIADLESWSDVLGAADVHSISFGGGTPGEFPAHDLVRTVQAARRLAAVTSEAEISLEANPGTTGEAGLRQLAAGGFNRVSFGAQSFDPLELRFLDRVHSPGAITASVANARAAGFGSVGLDLIYGLPGQSLDAWLRSLRSAVALRPEHLSCYALTVEEGTPLGLAVQRGRIPDPDPDSAATMYEATEEFLNAAGYRHYEISNWALPGHESRHNRTYWDGGDYAGIGAGAHGFIGGERFENIAHPRTYIAAAGSGEGTARPFVANSYVPARATAISDWFETRLRLVEGVDIRSFEVEFRSTIDTVIGAALDQCVGYGLLARDGHQLRLTPRGRLLHSEVCARVLAHLQSQDSARRPLE